MFLPGPISLLRLSPPSSVIYLLNFFGRDCNSQSTWPGASNTARRPDFLQALGQTHQISKGRYDEVPAGFQTNKRRILMRSTKWTRRMVVQGIICALGIGAAYADAPAPKWYDSTTLSGYVQGNYVGNLSKDTPQTNQLRAFDPNQGFGLPQAQLKLSKPAADDSAGFVVKLLAGTNAAVIPSQGGNTDTNFDLEEANMTFNVPKVKGLTFT